jgi:hypothetical protein
VELVHKVRLELLVILDLLVLRVQREQLALREQQAQLETRVQLVRKVQQVHKVLQVSKVRKALTSFNQLLLQLEQVLALELHGMTLRLVRRMFMTVHSGLRQVQRL